MKANNLWALLVDILSSPTSNPDLDYSERGVFSVYRTTGHFVDGCLSITLCDTTLPTYFQVHWPHSGISDRPPRHIAVLKPWPFLAGFKMPNIVLYRLIKTSIVSRASSICKSV